MKKEPDLDPKRDDPRFRVITPDQYGRYLENILENIDLAIFMVTPDDKIAYWNSRMETFFAPRENVLGKRFTEIFPQFSDEADGVVWEVVLRKNVIADKRTIEARRFPLHLPNGTKVPCHMRAFPVREPGGEVLGAAVAIRDISREVIMEEELLLKARTTSLAHLAASLAHEIRNPLNSISLHLQVLREEIEESGEGGELAQSWDKIENEITRLNDLLKEFMVFSKPQALKQERTDVNQVLGETLELLGEQARRKKIEVIVEYGPLPDVFIDQSRLRQAIYNITLNAIEILPKGGRIEIVTFASGQWVALKFEDNGPGIEEKDLNRLFDLFYTTKEKGTGLGLTIASRFVEEQHGHITVDSLPGSGATFTIFLPAKLVSS